MYGYTYKAAIFLLAAVFLPSLTIASNTDYDSSKTKIYGSKLGCMSCHQGASMQSDKPSKKSNDQAHVHNQAKP